MAYLFVATLKCIPATNCLLLLSSRQLDQPRSLALAEKDSVLAHGKLTELRLMGVQITNAQSDRIIEALETLQRRGDGDSLLLAYFASHGVISKSETFIAAENTRSWPVRSGEISLSQINAYLNLCPSTKRLVILDACRERARAGIRGDAESEDDLASADLSEAIRKALPGTAVFTSCKDDEYSWEDPNLPGGVFTQKFIETLTTSSRSTTNELLTLDQASRLTSISVASHVRRHFGKSQNPWVKEYTGDMLSFPLSYTLLGFEIRSLASQVLEVYQRRKTLVPHELWPEISKQIGSLPGHDKKGFLTSLLAILSAEPDDALPSTLQSLMSDLRKSIIVPPRIQSVETAYSVLPDEPWTVDIAVDGTEPLSYIWQFQSPASNEWQPLPGSASRILVVQSVDQQHVGSYRLVVTNIHSQSVTSAVVALKLRYKPLLILEHPFAPSDKIREGESLTLTVKTAGGSSREDPTQFRWQHRVRTNAPWVNIVRAPSDGPTLELKGVNKLDEGEYRVRVFNSASNHFSQPTEIRVVARLKWLDKPNGETLTTGSVGKSRTLCSGASLDLKVEAVGNAPIKYSWQFRPDDTSMWKNIRGANASSLKISECSTDNAGEYRAVVEDAEHQTLQGDPFKVEVIPRLSIDWPKNQTVLTCESVDFTVSVEAGEADDVTWFKKEGSKWQEILKDMTILHIESATPNDAGIFKVRAENDCGVMESPPFKLTVSPRQFKTFKLNPYPLQTYERQGTSFFDTTGGQRVLAGTEVRSGFDGAVFAIGWHPPVGAFQTYSQVMPCGEILSVTTWYGRTIVSSLVVGQFID